MSGARPRLQVSGLTVHHGGVQALHDVSLDVADGDIAGLIGPNGAGKTTFIDTLSGFKDATTGHVLLDGVRIDLLPPHQRARLGLVRTFQSLELFDDLTVRENLLVAAVPATQGTGLRDLLRPRRRAPDSVERELDELGLAGMAERKPAELSNGQRHMVALARALVAQPRVLLLDEPAAGLDSNESAALGRLLKTLSERGVTVLLVDHDMSVVLGVCDMVHVLDFGGLIASGAPAHIRHDPMVISAYLGDRGAA